MLNSGSFVVTMSLLQIIVMLTFETIHIMTKTTMLLL